MSVRFVLDIGYRKLQQINGNPVWVENSGKRFETKSRPATHFFASFSRNLLEPSASWYVIMHLFQGVRLRPIFPHEIRYSSAGHVTGGGFLPEMCRPPAMIWNTGNGIWTTDGGNGVNLFYPQHTYTAITFIPFQICRTL